MEPEEIEGRQFGTSLRGYDRQEVEDFVREIAEHVRQLRSDLAAAQHALEVAKAASAPAAAGPSGLPAAVPAPRKTDAYRLLGEETARILISAEQAANEIREQAKREAAEVLADARRHAGRIARQAREGKQQAEGDLRQLLHTRGLLAGQLEDVRQRLAEAVARLQLPLEPPPQTPTEQEPPDVLPSLAGSDRSAGPVSASASSDPDSPPDKTSPPERPSASPEPSETKSSLRRGGEHGEPLMPPGSKLMPPSTARRPRQTRQPLAGSPTARATERRAAPPDHTQHGVKSGGSSSPAAPVASEEAAGDSTQSKPSAGLAVGPTNGSVRKPEPPGDVVDLLLQEIREDSKDIAHAWKASASEAAETAEAANSLKSAETPEAAGPEEAAETFEAADPDEAAGPEQAAETSEAASPVETVTPVKAAETPEAASPELAAETPRAAEKPQAAETPDAGVADEGAGHPFARDNGRVPDPPGAVDVGEAGGAASSPVVQDPGAGADQELNSGAADGYESDFFKKRANALGESPYIAARKLKRLLQEDHNDLLHRLRSQRGRGGLEQNMVAEQEQLERFELALGQILADAFARGRRAGGAKSDASSRDAVSSLVAKQVVFPLRSDLCRVVESGLAAQDTPSSISERASDVFRIWKGVRTELLGEGLVLAAFHQGLLEAWKSKGGVKRWVLSDEEQECPKGVCQANVSKGPVPVQGQFSSGHSSPPAHGGCTCGLQLS